MSSNANHRMTSSSSNNNSIARDGEHKKHEQAAAAVASGESDGTSDMPSSTSATASPSTSSRAAHANIREISCHRNDVLCGRGGGSCKNFGNYVYRNLVNANKELYLSSKRHEKIAISQSIVAAIRAQNPSGRFLEKDPNTGLYFDIGDKRAVEKTRQALREGAPNLRKKLKTLSSSSSPSTSTGEEGAGVGGIGSGGGFVGGIPAEREEGEGSLSAPAVDYGVTQGGSAANVVSHPGAVHPMVATGSGGGGEVGNAGMGVGAVGVTSPGPPGWSMDNPSSLLAHHHRSRFLQNTAVQQVQHQQQQLHQAGHAVSSLPHNVGLGGSGATVGGLPSGDGGTVVAHQPLPQPQLSSAASTSASLLQGQHNPGDHHIDQATVAPEQVEKFASVLPPQQLGVGVNDVPGVGGISTTAAAAATGNLIGPLQLRKASMKGSDGGDIDWISMYQALTGDNSTSKQAEDEATSSPQRRASLPATPFFNNQTVTTAAANIKNNMPPPPAMLPSPLSPEGTYPGSSCVGRVVNRDQQSPHHLPLTPSATSYPSHLSAALMAASMSKQGQGRHQGVATQPRTGHKRGQPGDGVGFEGIAAAGFSSDSDERSTASRCLFCGQQKQQSQSPGSSEEREQRKKGSAANSRKDQKKQSSSSASPSDDDKERVASSKNAQEDDDDLRDRVRRLETAWRASEREKTLLKDALYACKNSHQREIIELSKKHAAEVMKLQFELRTVTDQLEEERKRKKPSSSDGSVDATQKRLGGVA